MSSEKIDVDLELVKLRKNKKAYCVLVGGLLFGGFVCGSMSYAQWRDSKFYGAPTDQCMFTNASLTLVACRKENTTTGSGFIGCNGFQTQFYYNTTDGTCSNNELYRYSACHCDDDPPPIPIKPGRGYLAPDKCWILSCESNKDWTFIEPVNERVEAWVFGIIAVTLIGIGMFYCCSCLQVELGEGERAAMIEEIGAKDAYDRFFKTIEAKDTDMPKEWKVLHTVVTCSTVAVPVILIGAFILATYSWGGNLSDNTISEGIQHRSDRNAMFRFTEAMTTLSVILASFVSWCRQVQIAVYFREYARYFGAKQAKIYRWLNVIAMVFNVVGYFGILELVSYDAARFGGKDPLHGVWAMIAFLSTGTFLLIATIITIKQRQVEYRRNIILEELSPCSALLNTFWYDAVLMLLLFMVGSVSLLLFFAEIAKANEVRSQVPEDERLNTFAYIRVFTAEWIAFFCFVSGIGALSLHFHHDHIAWEIHDYLKQEVILWPGAENIFKCLGCCCCCCCNLKPLEETVVGLEMQIQKDEEKEKDKDKELKETSLVIETDPDEEM
eukprot:152214_1